MYNVTVTINLPDQDWDEERVVDSLDGLIEDVKREYPTATSVVLVLCI